MGEARHRGTQAERIGAAKAKMTVAEYRKESINKFGHFGTENLIGVFSTGSDDRNDTEMALKAKRSEAAKRGAATRKAKIFVRLVGYEG